MKVAFITPQFPNICLGGSPLYAYHLAQALNKNVDLTVFLPKINVNKLDYSLNYKTIPISQKPLLRNLTFWRNVSKSINTSEYDIIHVNEYGGLFLNRIDVLTFHHFPNDIFSKFHIIPTYLEAIKSSIILTVSEKSKKELIVLPFLKKKEIKVIYNGISPTFLQKEKVKSDHLSKKYNINGKKVITSVISEMTKRKNLPLILDTIKELKEKVVFILICKKSHINAIKQKLKEKKIDDVTICLANLSDKELKQVYFISDLVAIPSLKEGFGLPMIEAVSMKKPFVAFDVGIAYQLSKMGFGLVAENNDDFKKKCFEMLKDPFDLDKTAKSYIFKHYSWDTTAKSLINLYNLILRKI